MNVVLKVIIYIGAFITVGISLLILFDEFIPKESEPEVARYKQTSSTAKLLSQIEEEKQEEANATNQKSVLKSYEVTQDDLAILRDESKYVQGKNHPFYDYTTALKTATSTGGEVPKPGSSTNTNSVNTNSSTNSSTNSATNESNETNSSNNVNTNSLKDVTNKSKTSK